MTPHANARLQGMRARCPDPVIIEHAQRLNMTVKVYHDQAGYVSGTEEQWNDLETILFSSDAAILRELQVKYE